MDNLKGFLIILVVLGHTLELVMDQGMVKLFYEWIYTFHMPVFILVSGYFFRFDLKKILIHLVYPYFLFQTLYLLFDRYILGNTGTWNYHTPYWLLWYLMAMVIWSFLTLFVQRVQVMLCTKFSDNKGILYRKRKASTVAISALAVSVLVALLTGYVEQIGRTWTLSRALVFFPFFLGGSFLGERSMQVKHPKWVLGVGAGVVAAYSLLLPVFYKGLKNVWFYGAVSYQEDGSTLLFRLQQLLIAGAFSIVLLAVMPSKDIRFLTKAGRNTMQIFLMHGFFIRLLQKYKVLKDVSFPLFTALLVSLLLVFVLSADLVGKITEPFMKGKIYEKKKSVSNCT